MSKMPRMATMPRMKSPAKQMAAQNQHVQTKIREGARAEAKRVSTMRKGGK